MISLYNKRTQMNDDDRDKIADLLDNESKMNTWECEFVDNIQDNTELTNKQKETLDRIHDEVMNER